MKKKILIVVLFSLLMTGLAVGLMTNYDSITGAATVEMAIELDIMGSSNDENYTLKDVHQGETKYSPKIKIKNLADVALNVDMNVTILPESAGDADDVNITIVDVNKNVTLENPIWVTPADLYIYIKHVFANNSETGDYFFNVSANPV